jgi:hypothetical protein
MRQSLMRSMIRASLLPSLFAALIANAAPTAQQNLSDLKSLVEKTKVELKRHVPVERKIASIQKFRSFVSDQLHRQGDLSGSLAKKPDPSEDVLALELIGLDQDLGAFMDDIDPAHFNSERCESYQHNLIHGYANSDSESPPPLPSHAQDTLIFLQLLCSSK